MRRQNEARKVKISNITVKKIRLRIEELCSSAGKFIHCIVVIKLCGLKET